LLRELAKGGQHAVEHCVLEERVLVGVAKERQFWEHNEGGVIVSGCLRKVEDLPPIVARVGDVDARRGNSPSDKSVARRAS